MKVWQERSAFSAPDDLVLCHPEWGKELDGSKVTRKFKQGYADADMRVIRFHDLRHAQTTQIYSHYQPSEREVDMVNEAFSRRRAV